MSSAQNDIERLEEAMAAQTLGSHPQTDPTQNKTAGAENAASTPTNTTDNKTDVGCKDPALASEKSDSSSGHTKRWLATHQPSDEVCKCAKPDLYIAYDFGPEYTGCYAILGWSCNNRSCPSAALTEITHYELPKFRTRMVQVIDSQEQRVLGPGEEVREGERELDNFTVNLMEAYGQELWARRDGILPSTRAALDTMINYIRGLHSLFVQTIPLSSLRDQYGPELGVHATFTYPTCWKVDYSAVNSFVDAFKQSKLEMELSSVRCLASFRAASYAVIDMCRVGGFVTYDNEMVEWKDDSRFVVIDSVEAVEWEPRALARRGTKSKYKLRGEERSYERWTYGWSPFLPGSAVEVIRHERGLAADSSGRHGGMWYPDEYLAGAAGHAHEVAGRAKLEPQSRVVLTGEASQREEFREWLKFEFRPRYRPGVPDLDVEILFAPPSISQAAIENAVARGAALDHAVSFAVSSIVDKMPLWWGSRYGRGPYGKPPKGSTQYPSA